MPIAYTDTTSGKTLVAYVAPGTTAEQAANAMRLSPGTWREITDEEAAALIQPTPEEQLAAMQKAFTDAMQARLDAFAQTRNYDNAFTATTYATSTNAKFHAEGQYMVEARDDTWAKGYEILGAVLDGTRPMPTIEEVMAELPELRWPDAVL